MQEIVDPVEHRRIFAHDTLLADLVGDGTVYVKPVHREPAVHRFKKFVDPLEIVDLVQVDDSLKKVFRLPFDIERRGG